MSFNIRVHIVQLEPNSCSVAVSHPTLYARVDEPLYVCVCVSLFWVVFRARHVTQRKIIFMFSTHSRWVFGFLFSGRAVCVDSWLKCHKTDLCAFDDWYHSKNRVRCVCVWLWPLLMVQNLFTTILHKSESVSWPNPQRMCFFCISVKLLSKRNWPRWQPQYRFDTIR